MGGMTKPSIALLPNRAVVTVTGPDVVNFLNDLLTQTVERGELRFAGLLTPQGRLLYDLFVGVSGETALLDVAAEHRDALLARLSMYKLRAKVELAASDLKVYALFGFEPDAIDGYSADPRLPGLGWRFYGDTLDATATEHDYDAHRLAVGVPGPADWGTDKTYPIEANFDLLNGIDFKKGCFVGQETTSRMKRRGTIKSRMLPIAFEGPPPAFGAEVLAGELRGGEVLSGRAGRAMALLRLDRVAGAELTVDGRAVTVDWPDWVPTPTPAE
jgi:folate-binding protein YgfZ